VQPGQLDESQQHFIIERRRQAKGVRASDDELPGDGLPSPLVPDAILEGQRLLLGPQPVRQRAQREFRQVQLVLSVTVVHRHRFGFDARLVFQDSPP
jgi:hypothetical protein